MTVFFKPIMRNQLAIFGGGVFLCIITLAIIAPILPLQDPNLTNTPERFLTPFSPSHLAGTDHLGRDLLSRLLHGTALSISVGIGTALIAASIGSLIGVIAGYFGGRIDNIIMRTIDILMAFPYILLALAIVAALGPGLSNALIAVAVVNIPFFARNIRGITVGLVRQEFIDAARLSGMGHWKIIFSELLPNLMPVITIAFSTTIGWIVLETAGLSFLGLGSQPPQADLGSMLGEARAALITYPHTSIIPGLMIFLIVVSINLLGDGVRDALDPRLHSGALSRPMPTTSLDPNRKKLPPSNHLLSVNNLNTQFHIGTEIYRAVNHVSFDLNPGECLGIIGESGSGKSVTALSIMRLVASPPAVITNGSIGLAGKDMLDADDETLRQKRGNKVAYIFQDPLSTLHPLYTIGQQLSEAITSHHQINTDDLRKKVIDLLNDVRIPNPENRFNSYPHELSGGMRQRVAIAMAIANDPDVIIADEPTTALDVTVQAQILDLLKDLRVKRGLAIIFITHDFGIVSQICDQLAVMYAGQIVEKGPTADILKKPAHPYTKCLIECVAELGYGKRKLSTISGLPPVANRLPKGCAFADRCTQSKEDCRAQYIALSTIHSRTVRCIHPEEI